MLWACFSVRGPEHLVQIHGIMDSIKYQQIKNLNLTASIRYLIMAVFGSSTRTTIQNKHQNKHKMNLLPCLSQSSDLNPTEDEWGELKRRSTVMELWIWRIWRDSGWRKWSLISYQVFFKLFRHYRRKLRVNLGKDAAIIANNCGQHELEKAFISQWDFPPTFNCFISMIG